MNLEIELKYQTAKQHIATQTGCKAAAAYHQGIIDTLKVLKNNTYGPDKTEYPQSSEPNEYRYIDADWLDIVAESLTEGAKNHPGGT